MKTIHKFHVSIGREIAIPMDPEARVLHTAMQKGHPTIWASVEIDVERVFRTFMAFGTGWEVPPGWQYIGTCHDLDGFVWHVHEFIKVQAS